MRMTHGPNKAEFQELRVQNKVASRKRNGATVGGHPNRVALRARSNEKRRYVVGAAAPQSQLAAF